MSMIFQFRALSDENDSFVRVYEVSYDSTLKKFNDLICEDLLFDSEEMSSFFLSDKQWLKLKEFTRFDMGMSDPDDELSPVSMQDVYLGNIIRNKHERLIYVFDQFEDRSLFIELMQSKEADAEVEYPRVIESVGEAPDQFDSTKAGKANHSIFDEAMDDFNDFEGDDQYDDEY